MNSLTTHVLDTMRGCPAVGVKIELWSGDGTLLKTTTTNADGRTDAPLLSEGEVAAGTYQIVFHVGDYFGERGFLNQVPVRFTIADTKVRYHVPLLVTPWAYSTYRG